jgi:hypothetical protein
VRAITTLLYAALLLSFANGSLGQTTGTARSASAASPASSGPPIGNRPVVPTVTADPMNRVGGPVYFSVTLKNVSDAAQTVENLVVKIEGAADSRFDGGSACELAVAGEVKLPPGESYTQNCRLPAQSSAQAAASSPEPTSSSVTGWESQRWYQSLFSADLRPMVEVGVAEAGTARFYPSATFTVKAPDSSIFIGGVVGAMLLALFVAAERILKNPSVREDWVGTIWVTVLMGLRGGLLAIFALLLGKTTQGGGSPVSLSVTDFAGGVLIGLFSYPLASWISSTLKLDNVFVSGKSTGAEPTSPASPKPPGP